jgi:hypothetical protein
MKKTLSQVVSEIRVESIQAIRRANQRLVADLKNAEVTALVAQELASLGLYFMHLNDGPIFWTAPECYVTDKKLFRHIHEAVGRLERVSDSPIGRSQTKVLRRLRPVAKIFKHISFYTETKLPKGAKCRVKTVKTSYRSVVCSN